MRPYKWVEAQKISLALAISQSLAALLGIFMAQLLETLVVSYSQITGSILIAFIGIKLMSDARKIKNEDRTYVLEDRQILGSISIASSFNILLAFLGLGMLGLSYMPSLLVFLLAAFLISQFGLFSGSHYQPIRLGRFAKFTAGLFILVLTIIYYFL